MGHSQLNSVYLCESPLNKAPCFQICKLPTGRYYLTAYEQNVNTGRQENEIIVQLSKESMKALKRFLEEELA